MTDDERSQREARRDKETYGRGGGDRFQADRYSHSYASARSGDWRRALRAYVTGHDRGWEADRKYREAEARTERTERPAREEAPTREPEPRIASGDAREATAGDEGEVRYGVPVPRVFTFHRGPSRWRERLPRRGRPIR